MSKKTARKRKSNEKCPRCGSAGKGGSYAVSDGMKHIRECRICGNIWEWIEFYAVTRTPKERKPLMNHDMKEMVESWHARLGKQIAACRKVRDRTNKDKKPEQAAMLAGKTKAYVEMRCFLESKYGKCMPGLLTKRQDEQK